MLNPTFTGHILVRLVFGMAFMALVLWACERVQLDLDTVIFGKVEAVAGVMWWKWPAQNYVVVAKLIAFTVGCFVAGMWFFRTIARSKWAVAVFVVVLAVLDFEFALAFVLSLAAVLGFFSWVCDIAAILRQRHETLPGAVSSAPVSDDERFDFFHENSNKLADVNANKVNPATGIPMINDILDAEGNVYGTGS